MQMTATRVGAKVPVVVLALQGDLDGSTYQSVIDAVQALYREGTRYLLLDLAGVPYMSSSGIVALVSIASLLNDGTYPDPEYGWAALHSIEQAGEGTKQKYLKLLNVQPRVAQVLETVGLKDYLEVFVDRDEALASFS